MEDKVLSEKESLALISEMINKAKGNYYESGSSALLWGFSNIVCFTLVYLMATVDGFNFPFNPFYLMIIPGILQIYFHRKDRKIKISVSYTDDTHSYVWMAFGISILVLTVAGGMSDIGYLVLPLLLLLFAIPTFISGCIKKFKPLIFGAFVCWILSAVCFFYRTNEVYLLVASGALFAWVIPGFILRYKFYKNIANKHNGI